MESIVGNGAQRAENADENGIRIVLGGTQSNDPAPRVAVGPKVHLFEAQNPRLFKSLAPLTTVPSQRILNDRISDLRGLDLVHFHGFSFKLLVVLEEAAQHVQPMR